MDLKNPDGLFPWYRDIFFPSQAGNEDFDWGRVYGLLTSFQNRYNVVARRRCRGMAFMHTGYTGDYCSKPLCPTCWHRRHSEMLAAIPRMPDKVTYIRQTWLVPWHAQLAPELIKRFKAKAARFQMVGYTLNFDAADTFIDESIAKADAFGGELGYSLIGLFQSNHVVRGYGFEAGQTNVTDANGRPVGVLDSDVVDLPTLRPIWLEQLRHPWLYRRHIHFDRYIRDFNPVNVGRSWTRVNKARLQE